MERKPGLLHEAAQEFHRKLRGKIARLELVKIHPLGQTPDQERTSAEIERNANDDEQRKLSAFCHENFSLTRRCFVEEWNCDLLGVFRSLRDTGNLELVASAATHGFLPLLQDSREAVRAQILIGRDIFQETFGAEPAGFWLPECAYAPGIENILQEANLRWFVLDAHGLMFGKPQPARAIYALYFTPAGPAAFGPRQARNRLHAKPGQSAHGQGSRRL